jgi:hypothetical protein
MTIITYGKFFNMNCDDVDYLTAYILSYLDAGLNDWSLSSIIVCDLGMPKGSSHMGLNQDYSGASSTIPLLFAAFLEKSFS